eukprot:16058102-Heterocapsa_arctica.AAC.1
MASVGQGGVVLSATCPAAGPSSCSGCPSSGSGRPCFAPCRSPDHVGPVGSQPRGHSRGTGAAVVPTDRKCAGRAH